MNILMNDDRFYVIFSDIFPHEISFIQQHFAQFKYVSSKSLRVIVIFKYRFL